MPRLATILIVPLAACTVLHDLDPSDLPTRDGAADPDAVLDADVPADPLSEDASSDLMPECSPTGVFESYCPVSVAYPDPVAPEGCDYQVTFDEQDLEGTLFDYNHRDLSDVCATLCGTRGYMKLYVPGDLGAHAVEVGAITTPTVFYYFRPSGAFTVSTRIINEFDSGGQTAGLYVMQDLDNILTVTVDHDGSDAEIWVEVDTDAGHYQHGEPITTGTYTLVDLAVQRDGSGTWHYVVNGRSYEILEAFSLDVDEIGIAVGNYSSNPPTAALFDYICLSEP